jgi:hypothetical protein
VSQVFQAALGKSALGCFQVELLYYESFYDLLDMEQMICFGGTIYEYIIKKDQYKFPQEGQLIHDTLECCRGICEAKWHHLELIVTLVSFEGSFILISR